VPAPFPVIQPSAPSVPFEVGTTWQPGNDAAAERRTGPGRVDDGELEVVAEEVVVNRIDVVDPPPAMVVELDPTTVVLEPAGVVLVILVELEKEPGNRVVEDDAIDGAAVVEEGLTAEVELLVDDDAVVVTVWASAPKVRRPNETIDEDSKTAKLRP
jgi:hypothetical protein